MKKQFLFMTFLSLVFVFAGVSKSFGQDLSQAIAECPTPTVITATCVANAGPLNPIAGTEYTYTANIPTPIGSKTYHWFVTTDLDLIATGGVLTTARELADGTSDYVASGSANYNVETAATAPTDVSVDITWKAFTYDPTQPVLLVVYVVDDEDCTNDNIEAYLIRPVHAFTLDIANLADDGTLPGATHEICVSPIETATYVVTNAATGEGEIQFDYGTNYMYFIVTAANYTDSWMPRFQVSGTGLTGSRLVTDIDWAYPADAVSGTWVPTTTTGTGTANDIFTGTTAVDAQAPSGSVDADGECIVVRLTIANNQDETIVDETITLAVDGIMFDAGATGDAYTNSLLADIHHTASPAPDNDCPWYDGFTNDIATQTLTARPDINQPTPAPDPATPFVPTDRD